MASGVKSISVLFAALVAAGCASQHVADDGSANGAASTKASGDLKAPATSAQVPAVDIQVVTAQFGVFGADPAGRRVLFETDKFPAITAAPYGWFILFKTDKPTVCGARSSSCLSRCPTGGRARRWACSPCRLIARPPSRNASFRLASAFVGNEWRYAPGDPVGAHKMRVYIDGQLVREFRFDIEEGPDDQRGTRSRTDRSALAVADLISGRTRRASPGCQRFALSQTFCKRLALTGMGVVSSCANSDTRSSSSSQRNSSSRGSATPLRAATSRSQGVWKCGTRPSAPYRAPDRS